MRELVRKGETALNVEICCADALAADAGGSFHVAQILCHEICLLNGLTEHADEQMQLQTSIESVKDRVIAELDRTFLPKAIQFARGRRFRREGRAPYLHLLHWLAESHEWSLSVDQALALHPEIRGSISQIIEKGHLATFLEENDELRDIVHYDAYTRVLGVEDPKFMYLLRNLLWSKFVKQVGFLSIEFRSRYDFGLSFAGEDRSVAEKLNSALQEAEMEVFYDKDEQHRILARDVEEYLAPIYRTEARFVLPLLSRNFPKKIWTKFESQQFKERFGENSVIPLWFSDAPPGMFDETTRVGGMTLDPSTDVDRQITEIVRVLIKRVGDERQQEESASSARASTASALIDDEQ